MSFYSIFVSWMLYGSRLPSSLDYTAPPTISFLKTKKNSCFLKNFFDGKE